MADYKVPIPFIRKVEGGLSKAQTDSARFDPVPDGSGYHTNKGITWGTFKTLAPVIGYSATPKLFYEMPDWLWEKIFKVGYWDQVGGDYIKSQAIANTLADYAWGTGPGTAARRIQKLVGVKPDGRIGPASIKAINKRKEKELFEALVLDKKNFYLTLPGQQANYKSWSNRLKQEEEFNSKLIVAVGVSLVGIVAGITAFFFTNNFGGLT